MRPVTPARLSGRDGFAIVPPGRPDRLDRLGVQDFLDLARGQGRTKSAMSVARYYSSTTPPGAYWGMWVAGTSPRGVVADCWYQQRPHDDGDRAVVHLAEPINSGYVLIKRWHLAKARFCDRSLRPP